MNEVILSRDDAGKVCDVPLDGVIMLCLHETPSSGYVWEASAEDGLELLASSFSLDPQSGIGGSGTRTFRFHAISQGLYRIEAKHLRQWIGESSIIDRCQFVLRVAAVKG